MCIQGKGIDHSPQDEATATAADLKKRSDHRHRAGPGVEEEGDGTHAEGGWRRATSHAVGLLFLIAWEGTNAECATHWRSGRNSRMAMAMGWCRSGTARGHRLTGQVAKGTRGGLREDLAQPPLYIPTPRPHGHETHGRTPAPASIPR